MILSLTEFPSRSENMKKLNQTCKISNQETAEYFITLILTLEFGKTQSESPSLYVNYFLYMQTSLAIHPLTIDQDLARHRKTNKPDPEIHNL